MATVNELLLDIEKHEEDVAKKFLLRDLAAIAGAFALGVSTGLGFDPVVVLVALALFAVTGFFHSEIKAGVISIGQLESALAEKAIRLDAGRAP